MHVSQWLWTAFVTGMVWAAPAGVSYTYFGVDVVGVSAEYWNTVPFKVSRGHPAAETLLSAAMPENPTLHSPYRRLVQEHGGIFAISEHESQ